MNGRKFIDNTLQEKRGQSILFKSLIIFYDKSIRADAWGRFRSTKASLHVFQTQRSLSCYAQSLSRHLVGIFHALIHKFK
jgi:hypothetical protein